MKFSGMGSSTSTTIGGFQTSLNTNASEFRNHIIRAGLNYHFGQASIHEEAKNYNTNASDLWSGAYVGFNFGYGISTSPATNTFSSEDPNLDGNVTQIAGSGIIGGSQLGYNFSLSPNWLIGLEADAQKGSEKAAMRSTITDGTSPSNITQLIEAHTSIQSFETVRARVGWLSSHSTMLFATMGLAVGQIRAALNNGQSVCCGWIATTDPTSGSFSQNKVGWAAGTGVETELWNKWTGKVEYLFTDFGSSDYHIPYNGQINDAPHTVKVRFQNHIARAGINYHF
jgi:outer membrane immunogenic protein